MKSLLETLSPKHERLFFERFSGNFVPTLSGALQEPVDIDFVKFGRKLGVLNPWEDTVR